MGNDSKSPSCTPISRSQYLSMRSQPFAFQDSYLYQTELEQVNEEKMVVVTYQLNLHRQDIQSYFQKLKMMSKYLCKGNIQLPLLCINQTRDECSCGGETSSMVQFYYENYEITLGNEIKARSRCFQRFSEAEVWYIMYGVVNALRQFQPFLEPSGNLTTQDIVLNNRGQIKMKAFLSQPFQPPRNSIFHNYFAPQQLQIMKRSFQGDSSISRSTYKQYSINPSISQVYSLGVILLVITTRCNPVNLYAPPFDVNQKNIQLQIDALQGAGYSRLLTNLVRIMLSTYRNRPLPSQIRQIFREYESEILAFRPFDLSLAESRVSSVF